MNRWRRPAVVTVVLVCAAGLVTGCGGAGGEPAESAADSSSPAPSHADCLSAERRAARNVWLWQAVTEVTSAPTGDSAKAQDTVAKRTASVEGQLLEQCGGRVPQAFTRFSNDVQPALAANRFGDPQLDQVLAAWLRWGSAVGAPEAAQREIQDLESCRREFFPLFDASYRVGSKGTETGKVWWVDLAFDNRTGKVLDGSMGGMATVTRMLEDPFGWEDGPKPGPGKNATLSWGGSSAEMLELQPGTTTMGAAPDIDHDVHTTADGRFRVTELTVGLGPRGERYWCSPPVRAVP
jgi:hypothetical protein